MSRSSNPKAKLVSKASGGTKVKNVAPMEAAAEEEATVVETPASEKARLEEANETLPKEERINPARQEAPRRKDEPTQDIAERFEAGAATVEDLKVLAAIGVKHLPKK